MKKIICTVTNDLTYDQRMIRICESLKKAHYEVLLVGRKKTDSIPLESKIFQQRRLFCFFQKGKFFYLEYNIRLLFFLFFQKADLVCAVDLDTILPAFFVSRMQKKILVYDAHEYFTEVPEIIRRPRIKKIWEKIAGYTLPKIQYAYTVGPELAKIMAQKYAISFEVIRNVPKKKEWTNASSKKDQKIILYQGVLNEGRGLEATIEAMQHLEGMELWLVGEGDLSKQLRQLSNDLQLTDKVKFWGYQKPDDLALITAQADIGLNLLENKGLSYYYSLANKCFDYIQAGLPSLQMKFPEYQNLNQQYDCFVLLDDLKPVPIAKAIQQLFDDENLYNKLQSNCLKARLALNWEKEEKKLIRFYKKIS